MKVYCGWCKYFDPQYGLVSPDAGRCEYYSNKWKEKLPDSWRYPGDSVTRYNKHPKDINTNNDCPNFEDEDGND